MEKGFFVAPDGAWTCYRRNYLAVFCSFQLHPHVANQKLYLRNKQVQAMGVRLSAAVAEDPPGSNGKIIELVQFTAKREQKDKTYIDVVKILPSTSPHHSIEHALGPQGVYQMPLTTFQATGAYSSPILPMQNVVEDPPAPVKEGESSKGSEHIYGSLSPAQMPLPGQSVSHTFERVQFKSATANNGKRRASQQYFHIIVELYADTRAPGAQKPSWEKLVNLVSEKLVVRGRSPSHYKDERPENGGTGRGGNAGGSSTGAPPPAAPYNILPSSGSVLAGPSGGSVGGFRPSNCYDYDSSPFRTPPSDGRDPNTPLSSHEDVRYYDSIKPSYDDDDADMHDPDEYTYMPAPLYEPIRQRLDSGYSFYEPIKHEYSPYEPHEPRDYAIRAEHPQATPGPNWNEEYDQGRLSRVPTSRGWYPTNLDGSQL